SMDGDVADLAALSVVAESAGALLVADEAHATGVFGEHGRGIGELAGVENHIAASVGTLSKSIGSIGGFVCGSQALIDTLVNEARSFIYTTALPPGCSAAALTALTIMARRPQLRRRVMALAAYVRDHLRAMDFDCGHSGSPIIPVICGSAEAALEASEVLRQSGIFVPAIRPPTVAPGTARLRLSLMATHGDDQIEFLLKQMARLRDRILVRS
ncbi:MAG: aminotransferase class I/II-fold pyridoxal phosphate-dependent enzyme, partial [Phycisphaerae bacterium]|nr:aminotransferase class I/II-fold pyridoxal phosphate-dependent enzyme [Phycisphaerae bacterium]